MKYCISALIAIACFVGLSGLVLDVTTTVMGKPARGVGYGISMNFLFAAVCVVGIATLLSTGLFSVRLRVALGVIGVFACVIYLLPQPGVVTKVCVALIISILLVTTAKLLSMFTASHVGRDH